MLKRRSLLQLAAAAATGVASTGVAAGCDTSGNQALPPPTPATDTSAPSQSPQAKALPAEVVNGPRDKPQVALTFHGQGDAKIVRQILDELAKGGAKATVLA